jgi:restriction system protein
MARKSNCNDKRTSPLEGFVDLVARLPWWVGVPLAFVAYTVLHRYALQRGSEPPLMPGQMGNFVADAMWRAAAGIGQYLVPLICLLGAAVSAYRRRHPEILLGTAQATDTLDGISWQEFELLVGEAFRRQGYSVTENGGDRGPDGGVDLVMRKGGEKFFVQCKQWKAFSVGVGVVRELYGVMAAHGATGGFVVTSGNFTNDADAFAEGRNITLIDGDKLRQLIRSAKAARSAGTGLPRQSAVTRSAAAADAHVAADAAIAARKHPIPATAVADVASPCPVCAKPMVRRVAKKGANAGQPFWGCAGFPGCRGTQPIG